MVTKKTTKTTSATSAINSIFGAAAAAPVEVKKGKGGDEPPVEMGENLAHLVACTLAIKSIEPIEETLQGELKAEVFDMFMTRLSTSGQKPGSFHGAHGDSSVQFQFKAKASVPADIAERLKKNGVAVETVEDVRECYIINPAIFQDQDKLGKLAIALQGLGFTDVVQKQQGATTFKLTESSFADMAKIADATERAEMVRATSTIAIAQVKIGGEDAKTESASSKAFTRLAGIIGSLKALIAKKK